MLFENSKTENCCSSGLLKFDEISKNDNSIRNHPKSFQSNTYHVVRVFCLVRSFFDALLTSSLRVQIMKIIAGPEL